MKVCTDSCLFGAWTAHWLCKNSDQPKRILDIGGGTGLLSLMLAQQLAEAHIDAVEMNADAALQAHGNFALSPWNDRLHIHQNGIQNFHSNYSYDFIICNPPFYKDDLKSENESRNTAHHDTGIMLPELIKATKRLLKNDGNFALLLPYRRTKEMEKIALDAGFYLQQKRLVKQTEHHNYFRSLLLFSPQQSLCFEDEMAIKKDNNQYTEAFVFLLKDYYLHL